MSLCSREQVMQQAWTAQSPPQANISCLMILAAGVRTFNILSGKIAALFMKISILAGLTPIFFNSWTRLHSGIL
jgi:hypothetical protein